MEKVTRKIIEIEESLCDGCANCIPGCPEQAIEIVETEDGPKARLVKDLYCDGLGACIGTCPTDALKIVEREVEAYDEEATIARIQDVAPEMMDEHLQHMKEHADDLPDHHTHPSPPGITGCPSARTMQWSDTGQRSQKTDVGTHVPSQLRQWPIQLHLVPPVAPYFRDANLAIIADCVPFTYANFHNNFLNDKAIAIGCPKLDDTSPYIDKIAQIIQIGKPRSIEVVVMEVPCCSGLIHIVHQAMQKAGKEVPLTETVNGVQGEVK